MSTIDSIILQINKYLVPRFEEKLRASVAGQEGEWLIEQFLCIEQSAYFT